jgi:hypothetical protein
MKVTEAEWKLMQARQRTTPEPKPGRIRSTKTVVDGMTFDSKREAQRWHELILEQRAGHISALRRQVPFAITINRMHVCDYIADFVYVRNGAEVVEDSKGFRTEMYRLKKKLVRAVYGVEIVES